MSRDDTARGGMTDAERRAARRARMEAAGEPGATGPVADRATPATPAPSPAPLATPRKRPSAVHIVLALIVLALVLAAVAAVAFMLLAPDGVTVPSLTGLTLDEATAALASAECTVGVVTYDPASTEPTWTVASQSVVGEHVDPGTAVDIVLAGAPPTTVPAVVGLSAQDASALLVGSALATPTVTTTYDDAVPSGITIAQDPPAGSVVMSGSATSLVVSLGKQPVASDSGPMAFVKKFSGPYSPKSVVATQTGLVFAQNMMYRHTVTVFDATTYALAKTIKDSVNLADFGYPEYPKTVQGGPVEAAVTPDGQYMYVSQYAMYGPGFDRPGDDDTTGPSSGCDPSFVYRIPLSTLEIDQVIKVGSVPKYVAVTPDGRYVLVTNWVSYTLSVIDVAQAKEVKTIKLGRHPRGIAVDSASKYAYIGVMGSSDIAKVNLADFSLSWVKGVGSTPRHVIISPDDRFLYVTLNLPNQVVKVDLGTGKVVGRVSTGTEPRSMAMSGDGASLYVVNYESNSVAKLRSADLSIVQTETVGTHPIGITYVNATREVWVCCYSGSIYIFRDPQ